MQDKDRKLVGVVSVFCTIFIAVLICFCAATLALKFIFWLLG